MQGKSPVLIMSTGLFLFEFVPRGKWFFRCWISNEKALQEKLSGRALL